MMTRSHGLGFVFLPTFLALGLYPILGYGQQPEQQQKNIEFVQRISGLALPEALVKYETFPWPAERGVVNKIFYGNKQFGFFSSTRFVRHGTKIQFALIPPTYREPLVFRAESVDGHGHLIEVELGQRRYLNPLGALAEDIEVLAPMHFPFTLVNWSFRQAEGRPAVYRPVVVNRLGEVIWLFQRPGILSGQLVDDDSFALLPGGRFLLLNKYANTRLVVVDAFGHVDQHVDFAENHIPFGNSHGVQYLKETNEIIYLSFECRTLGRTEEFLPIFQGPLGWLRLLTLPRRTYRGSKLIRMSLTDLKPKEIWNSFMSFSPARNPNLGTGFLVAPDRFMDARDGDQYRRLLARDYDLDWWAWPDQHCDVDWTHENSVHYLPRIGYLLSVRNLNKIILLDEEGQLRWSVGEGAGNEYHFAEDGSGFSMQHSAQFLDATHVLLYDNHSPYRGDSGIRLGNRVTVLNLANQGLIKPEWTFVLPSAHSDVRGSVSALARGSFFAYTAGNPGVAADLFEIDRDRSAVVGHLRLGIYTGAKGIEAKPFSAFAGDTFLAPPSASASTHTEARDFLEYAY